MSLNINQFSCPGCQQKIEPWVARRPQFTCPACGQVYLSNYRSSLKRSVLLGLFVWIGGAGLGALFIEPWQMVFAFALEFGGLLAFLVAYLFHRFSIRIVSKSDPNTVQHSR